MNASTKFSIIVPCYNVEKYIDECVYSVINQTYSNWELILVNDGSTDGTKEKLDAFAAQDNRIIVLDKPHGGLPNTRNYGINYLSGDYLALLDGDDFFELDHLQNEAKIIEKKHCDMIIHNCIIEYSKTGNNRRILFSIPKEEIDNCEKIGIVFSRNNYLPASAWLTTYYIDFLKRNKFYYGEEYTCSEDVDFFFQAFCASPQIAFSSNSFYYYRQDNPSSMTNNLTATMEIDRLRIFKKWYDYYRENKQDSFDSEMILEKISNDLCAQIYISKGLRWKERKKVFSYFVKNRYLFSKNNFKGSFWYVYFIAEPVNRIFKIVKNMNREDKKGGVKSYGSQDDTY